MIPRLNKKAYLRIVHSEYELPMSFLTTSEALAFELAITDLGLLLLGMCTLLKSIFFLLFLLYRRRSRTFLHHLHCLLLAIDPLSHFEFC